jgi:hypothetical protein
MYTPVLGVLFVLATRARAETIDIDFDTNTTEWYTTSTNVIPTSTAQPTNHHGTGSMLVPCTHTLLQTAGRLATSSTYASSLTVVRVTTIQLSMRFVYVNGCAHCWSCSGVKLCR